MDKLKREGGPDYTTIFTHKQFVDHLNDFETQVENQDFLIKKMYIKMYPKTSYFQAE